jgi:HK97 family phage portal protein
VNLRARLAAWIAPKNAIDSGDVRRGDGVWESLTGGLMAQTGAPSEQAALSVSAVYACVQLISGAIASLPMHVYQRAQDGDLSRDVNSDLWWTLNEQFCPRWAAAPGWSFLVGSKLLHGDGFAEILRGPGGRISGLVPIHPDRVRVVATPDGSRLVYEIQPDRTIERPSPIATRARVLDQDDVLHVPGFGFNGLRGLSPLKHALRVTGRLAINAQDFSSRFLENMARPDYALKVPGNLTQDQVDRLRAMLDQHKGTMAGGKPLVLEGGMGIEPLTMPLEEMQLLDTRKFQVEEIARIYGVPAWMIGHTVNNTSWGSGIESMGKGFVRFALRDHLNGFQNEINRKFFRNASRVAEFDTSALELGDTKALYEALRIALGRAGEPAFISVEEARQKLNMSREVKGELPVAGSLVEGEAG